MVINNEAVLEKIVQNWDKFFKLATNVDLVGSDRVKELTAMLNHFSDRAPMTPASSRLEYHGAYPGGLVDHSLRVLEYSLKLAKTYGFDSALNKGSLVIGALFHDWGKVGSLEEDYYLDQDSQWHRERGMMYSHNDKIQYMTVPDRALFLMQHFGVKLSSDEYLSILLNDGAYAEENRPYLMKEPTLAVIIHQADRMACQFEKGRESLV